MNFARLRLLVSVNVGIVAALVGSIAARPVHSVEPMPGPAADARPAVSRPVEPAVIGLSLVFSSKVATPARI